MVVKGPSRAEVGKKEDPLSETTLNEGVVKGLKGMNNSGDNQTEVTSFAQKSKQAKDFPHPQSGLPISDSIIDTVKFVANPPSRAQVDKKELPTSGSPVSD